MKADAQALRRLIRRVLATRDSEPDVEEAEAALAALAEAVARGEDVSATRAWLAPHLAQSTETAELLEELVHLARLEAKGALPSVEALLADLAGAAAVDSAVVGLDARHPRTDGRVPLAVRLAAALARLRPEPVSRPLGSIPLGAAPVLGLALATAVGGWWRADRRADESLQRLTALEAALETAAAPVLTSSASARTVLTGSLRDAERATPDAPGSVVCPALEDFIPGAREERYARDPAGPWSRVLFEPEGRRALVWCGDVAAGLGPQDLECWAVGADGLRSRPRIVGRSDEGAPWWLIETDLALTEYDALELTAGADGDTLVRVDLGP